MVMPRLIKATHWSIVSIAILSTEICRAGVFLTALGQLNSVFPLKIEGARSCRWKMMHFFTSWSPQITQNYLLKAANACLTSTCNSDSCVLLTLNSTISLSRGVLSAQFWLPVSDWLFTDRLYW
ncbi:hypothetical protein T4A_12370 [Trichinella pseudospiralis]|uniref:Uncharacterized protein n=1 Tax=Trichinella pseudospiralis TaxID=6337 RepID=A0A0V1F0W7_TRIPS|nr:hypothetical protein T4A_12370 [Trichinella pseudospiralis]